MRDITLGQKSPAHMTAEEDFRSLPKWAEHVSCGEMATAFISVGAYYAHPQRLKISRDCRIKDESCDELPVSDQEVFGFAGLWDRSYAADGTAIESCVHITMPANPMMQDIHNTGKDPHRMPVILRKEDHEAWLGGTHEEARAALQQYPADLMYAYAVSSKVNSPKNNSPDLLESIKGAQTSMQ